MRDLVLDVLVSERFAINVLANYYRIPNNEIEHVSGIDNQSPIDLRYKGATYDVKFSNPTYCSRRANVNVWDFDIRYKKDYCDFFLLVGMEEYKPKAVFLVPTRGTPTRHIRVSVKGFSKWHKYLIWKDPSINFQDKPQVTEVKRERTIRQKYLTLLNEQPEQPTPCVSFFSHKWILRKQLKYSIIYRCSKCHAKTYYSPLQNKI